MRNKFRQPNAAGRRKKVHDRDEWRAALDSTFINDGHWRCTAAMMMETLVEHSRDISLFHESVEDATQTCIYSLSYDKAMDTVKTLSKQDPRKCPAIEGICHYASVALDENNGRLSTWLVARIIKYLIYRAKIEHIGKLNADQGRGIEDRAARHINGATTAGSGILHREADGISEYALLNGKPNAPVHVGEAVRSDEPNLYIVLSGFHDPDLPAELLHAGVPLTCILEVQTSDPERYVTYRETEEENISTSRDRSRFPRDYRIADKNTLSEFWSVTYQRLANLSAYPAYSDLAVLAFCPPSMPEISNIVEQERSLKRDTYDKALLILRHLNDLCRQHAEYLRRMRLEKGITDKHEKMDTKVYEEALKDIPNEYVSVPLVLCAVLLQVESNLTGSSDGCSPVDRDTGLGDAHTNSSTIAGRIPVSILRDRLEQLDRKHELPDECISINRPSRPAHLKVIPHADVLGMITSHFGGSTDLADGVLRVLRDPRIINAWQNHETPTRSKSEAYSCHTNNIARLLDRSPVTVSYEETIGYLHLLLFEKWIFPNSREIKAHLTDEPTELKCTRSTIRRTQSAPDLVSSTIFGRLRRFRSDTEIHYGKPVVTFTDCPLLFALTDTRETLHPGYLYENVWRTRSYERPGLGEYEDLELLPARVFLQIVHECFQSFDRFAARYFEPTDSMLLYFSNNIAVGSASERRRLSSIRTPVGLWEFSKYIAGEEENWINRERETDLAGRFMKKSIEVQEQAITFGDECFVLPDSLKARHLKENPDRDAQKKISETELGNGTASTTAGNAGSGGATRQKRDEAPNGRTGTFSASGETTSTSREKKSSPEIDDVDTSFLPAKKIPSSGYAGQEEWRDLPGYDLGRLHVQVIHHSKNFLLADDTSVRVELEDWLHGRDDLRVAVTLRRCTLRLSNGADRRHGTADTFHLTTKRGVVLSFCRKESERAAVRNSFDCQWQNLAFDFRASWPSGLLIEPAIGAGTKNPFCIRQSYVAKCPGAGRAGAAREVCRNFLRNGTVLKYLDDNTVVILRPNGVIVTCMGFDEPRLHDESVYQTAETALKESRRNGWRQSGTARREEKVMSSTGSRFDGSIADVQPLEQHVPSPDECVIRNEGDPLITQASVTGNAKRYSVLDYDGRHYEVSKDLLVSEHDRLLVRTTSDHEVGETLTRRADGTDTLFRSSGELIVTFPDGTRVITDYVIQEEPVMCEWSQDELQRYFGCTETEEHENSTASSHNKFSHEDSSITYCGTYGEKPERLSLVDGFVSILLTYRIEHEDYATVSYDQSAVVCTLSMPDNLHVSVSARGHYEVSMGDEVNLKTQDGRVVLTEMCATCGGNSTTVLTFCEPSVGTGPSRTFLTVTDIFGNAVEVKGDGSTSFHFGADPCAREGHERNAEHGDDDDDDDDDEDEDEDEDDVSVGEHNGKRRNNEEQRANSETRIHRKHERYCEMLKFPARSQYRIFAMNRDLTAREYLHRSVRREQEVAAVFGDEMSMIQYPISRRPELRRLITFVPVEPELGSKELSCQYWVSSDKRVDYQRNKLLRSTYSSPYNWLFPFGKRNQVVSEKTQSEIFARRSGEPSLPKLLRTRVFFGIKETDRNILIDMQRAMGRYWISVFRDGDKCRLSCATGRSRACQVENDYKSSEEKELRELAMGVRESIDFETYVRSLRGKLIKVSAEAARQSSRLAELLRQRCSMKEEYEWYKQCMSKRIIMPYFQNIAHLCYCLMSDLVDEAVQISERNCSAMNLSMLADNRDKYSRLRRMHFK